MQPPSPRDVSRHGMEQSPDVHGHHHRQALEQREDMRLAHSSVKIMRSLCREYGVAFQMPHTSLHESSSKRKAKGGSRSNASSVAASPEPSSSSCSDLEERQDDGDGFARWPAVQELLDGLQTGRRVKVLKEISKSLNESAERAERNIKEIDAKSVRSGSRASDAEVQAVVNEDLLHFNPEETPAAQAVKRCQTLVPELRQRALEKAEASKASMMRALYEAQALSEEARAEASDSDASDDVKQNDIERKFQQLGELPHGAHPDLQIVLDLQREEIRAVAQRIKDAERDLQVKRWALEYVDGKLSSTPDGDQETVNAAISLAQDMKAEIYSRQKAEAERRLLMEQKKMNVPTEEEVQEQVAESERLQQEVIRAAEQVKRLQELSAAAMNPAGDQGEGATAAEGGQDGPAQEGEQEQQAVEDEDPHQRLTRMTDKVMYVQEASDGERRVVVDLAQVTKVHRDLSREAAGLEEKIAAEDKRIAQAESVMRNAEQTLKVLEEAKTLLLEHVAREKPALIEGLLPPPEIPEESGEDDKEAGSSTPSSESAEDEEAEDEEEAAERLKSLASEELRIRTQLAEAAEEEKANEGGGALSSSGEDEEVPKESKLQTKKDYGRRCTKGLLRLARQLREDPDSPGTDADAEAGDESDSADSNSPRVWTPPEELTREEAILQLRSMPHEELKSLLRLRNENERLMKQIEQARRELERVRVKQGNPKALLAADDLEGALQEGVPPELVVEVRRRVRELCALRKRWWRDRQDESTTVRRSLAAVNLPEDAETDDHPPPAAQESLFQRIHASMTLP